MQAVKGCIRERNQRLSEGDIAASADGLKAGGLMEKWLWRKTLSRLYKDEERLKIELQVIEFIRNSRAFSPVSKTTAKENGD